MEQVYWYILATLFALMPVYFIKAYVSSGNQVNLLITIFLYILLMVSYINIFEKHQVSTSYTILQITQILFVVSWSVLFFQEKLDINKIIGISFGIASVYLLL